MEVKGTYGVLVEAVERYVNQSDYPNIKDICAILGIEREVKKCTDISVLPVGTI